MRVTRIIYVVGVILLYLASVSIVKAQGICVIPRVKVFSVKGKVLSKQEGVPEVTVELRDWREQTRTLTRILTNTDGNFELKGVKKGKYLLVVSRTLFSPLHIPVQVTSKTRIKDKILFIHLALDSMDPCAEGGVELKPPQR